MGFGEAQVPACRHHAEQIRHEFIDLLLLGLSLQQLAVADDLREGREQLVPEGGLFVMLDIRGLGKPSEEVRRFLLQEAGIVLIHGSAYGPCGEGTLRVSFAGGGATLERGLERLRASLVKLA